MLNISFLLEDGWTWRQKIPVNFNACSQQDPSINSTFMVFLQKRISKNIHINYKQKLYFTCQNYLFYLAGVRGLNFWCTSRRNCLDLNEGTLSGFLHANPYLLYQQHCGTLRKAQILQVSFLESGYQESLLQAYEKDKKL